MTPKDYQKLALRTEPTEEQYKAVAERLSKHKVIRSLENAFFEMNWMTESLDRLKKHIFYGKEVELRDSFESSTNSRMIKKLQDPKTIRVLHSILGLATETGELIEMLRQHLSNDKELDLVNMKEEIGDLQWYNALGLDVCESSFEEVMERNIEKLAARYGDKFSDIKALNRDLETERKILEK